MKLLCENLIDILKDNIRKRKTKKFLKILAVEEEEKEREANIYFLAKELDLNVDIELNYHKSYISILKLITKYNEDDTIHGIYILSIPEYFAPATIYCNVLPNKDVQAKNAVSYGLMHYSMNKIFPVLESAIVKIVEKQRDYKINNNITIVSDRNNNISLLTQMLYNMNFNVSVCTPGTKTTLNYARMSDIIILFSGEEYILDSMLSDTTIVINAYDNDEKNLERLSPFMYGYVPYKVVKDIMNLFILYNFVRLTNKKNER